MLELPGVFTTVWTFASIVTSPIRGPVTASNVSTGIGTSLPAMLKKSACPDDPSMPVVEVHDVFTACASSAIRMLTPATGAKSPATPAVDIIDSVAVPKFVDDVDTGPAFTCANGAMSTGSS